MRRDPQRFIARTAGLGGTRGARRARGLVGGGGG